MFHHNLHTELGYLKDPGGSTPDNNPGTKNRYFIISNQLFFRKYRYFPSGDFIRGHQFYPGYLSGVDNFFKEFIPGQPFHNSWDFITSHYTTCYDTCLGYTILRLNSPWNELRLCSKTTGISFSYTLPQCQCYSLHKTTCDYKSIIYIDIFITVYTPIITSINKMVHYSVKAWPDFQK